jgi:hypothetical protein
MNVNAQYNTMTKTAAKESIGHRAILCTNDGFLALTEEWIGK